MRFLVKFKIVRLIWALFLLLFLGLIGVQESVAQESVCSFENDVPLSKEYFVNDPAITQFLKLYPTATYLSDSHWHQPLPAETYAKYTFKDLQLVFQILEYNPENTRECYFINGYKLFNQHTPNHNELNFQKDPNTIIESLDTVKPLIKDGSLNESITDEDVCGLNAILVEGICTPACSEGTQYIDGICHVIKTEKHGYGPVPNFVDALFFMQIIMPFFVPGAIIFVVLSKTPRFNKTIRLSVCIPAIIMIMYFLSGLFLGWYPLVYA